MDRFKTKPPTRKENKMSSKSASLMHARQAQEFDQHAPEDVIRGMFTTKKPRFTLRDWMERRKAQGKEIGYGYSPQPTGLERRKARA